MNYKNKEEVLIDVTNDGLFLEYAPEEIRNDKKVVSIATLNNVLSLKYASAGKNQRFSEEPRNDKDVVTIAIENYEGSLQFASAGKNQRFSEELRNDEFLLGEILYEYENKYYDIFHYCAAKGSEKNRKINY